MNTTVFVSLLVFLQLICLWVGKRSAKQLRDPQDYFLAGKELYFFPLFMTFIATQIGGGLVLGAAEEAYQFGWGVLLYPLGACLGFVALALGVGKKLAQFQVTTVAELLGVVYQSDRLKKMASLLSRVSLLMILMAQVIASRKFMGSLGLDYPWLFFAFWGIVILYTVMGGLKAVVAVDIIQAAFFIAVFAFGLGWILYTHRDTVTMLLQDGSGAGEFRLSTAKLSGWLLMPLLFMVIEQDMAQRCFAARSPRVVTQAAAYAAICTLVVCIIPVLVGILGKRMGIVVPPGSSVFMDTMRLLTTPWVAACVGCAVLMAVLSTAISLLNAISSNLTQDFDLAILKKRMQSVSLSRGVTAGVGLIAVGGSFYAGAIVDLLIQSYELSVYCLFVPVSAALIKPQGNVRSAWCAFILGGMGFCLTRTTAFAFPNEFICLFLSLLGYGISEYWLRTRLHTSDRAISSKKA